MGPGETQAGLTFGDSLNALSHESMSVCAQENFPLEKILITLEKMALLFFFFSFCKEKDGII